MKTPSRHQILKCVQAVLTNPDWPEVEQEAAAREILLAGVAPWYPAQDAALVQQVDLEFEILQTLHGRVLWIILETRKPIATAQGWAPLPERGEVFTVTLAIWNTTLKPWFRQWRQAHA